MAQDQQGQPLSEAERLKIDGAFARLADQNYYELLGVERDADRAALKRAYYQISKEFHPDRFFRRPLGTYKEKLEVFFDLLTKAYNTLSDPDLRAAYDRENPPVSRAPVPPPRVVRTPDVGAGASAAPLRGGVLPSSGEPRPVAPRVPTMPGAPPPRPLFQGALERQLVERIKKARGYFDEARVLYEKSDYRGAIAGMKMALTFDPNLKDAQRIIDESEGQLADVKAELHFIRAQQMDMLGNNEGAKQLYRMAVECKPRKAQYYYRYAQLTKSPAELREHLEALKNAVIYAPDNKDYILTLAAAYETAGMPRNALREYEKVLKVEPANIAAQQAVKKLKGMI